MSKDQNPSDKACDAYFDNPYAATSGSYYSDRVTFYAGFAAGAASRDAEVYTKQGAIDMLNQWNDELLAQIKQKDAEVARLEQERDQLRAELVKALAACKVKDEALLTCQTGDYSTGYVMHPSFDEMLVERAIATRPDDSALKMWLGEPVAYMNPYGGIVTKPSTGLEQATYTIPLYSPKELK